MSWSGTNKLMWGDSPQDEVDDAVESKLGSELLSNQFVDALPRARRKEVYDLLLDDKELRGRVDVIYEGALGRSANKAEYKNLLEVGLGLGGRMFVAR